ncbi:hypothetical protein [Cognatishimia sp. F0-27]|uniref:hypothetical protein n=1 Tax=Cognatishimia sp. F0-27 TaxID=2816855 RepID=UPI001D0CC2C2|nr:hypothetical protein [Cognatishimia sp. F0-27]MCC1491557.1 signal recognition particle [Cognatishimia sp. F0-27]
MKPTLSLTAFILVLSHVPSFTAAQSFDSMQKAQELGSLLASEEFCQLHYNQDAIEVWIDGNTDGSDMGFPSKLRMMTDGASFDLQSMSESSKTAHCRSIERTARHFGFVE